MTETLFYPLLFNASQVFLFVIAIPAKNHSIKFVDFVFVKFLATYFAIEFLFRYGCTIPPFVEL